MIDYAALARLSRQETYNLRRKDLIALGIEAGEADRLMALSVPDRFKHMRELCKVAVREHIIKPMHRLRTAGYFDPDIAFKNIARGEHIRSLRERAQS